MLNAGDIIYEYEIEIDYTKNKVNTTIKEHKVLGANERLVVLDDRSFTRLDQKKDRSYNSNLVPEYPHCYEGHYSNYWDYVRGYLYAKKKSKANFNKLKKAIEDFLYEKHGRYCRGVEFLKDITFEGVE